MKRSSVLAMAMMMGAASIAFAQENRTQPQPRPRADNENIDMEQFSQMMVFRLQKMLGLNGTLAELTEEALLELTTLQMEIERGIALSGDESGNELSDEEISKRKERETALIEELDEVLNEEQMDMFLEYRERGGFFGGGKRPEGSESTRPGGPPKNPPAKRT